MPLPWPFQSYSWRWWGAGSGQFLRRSGRSWRPSSTSQRGNRYWSRYHRRPAIRQSNDKVGSKVLLKIRYLNSIRCTLVGNISSQSLGNGGVIRVASALVHFPGRFHPSQTGGLDTDGHISEQEGYSLDWKLFVEWSFELVFEILTWWKAMGTPKVFLSRAYLVASSIALWARPVAPAATCTRM